MKRCFPLVILAFAVTAAADIPVQKVADDAKVIDRVAEAAKRDLPQDLLKRIVNEDIDLLRGKRTDSTYEFATYERLEASRSDTSTSIQPPKGDSLTRAEIKGSFVYRLIIDLPTRRMLVTKNRRVFVDHVELEYIPINSSATQRHTEKIEAWMEPGETKPIEFPEVARQATARVFAKADEKAGYGNMTLTLVKARVVDNADSPYADAVASAKAIIRAIDNSDILSIRAMASRMHDRLVPAAAVQSVDVIAPKPVTQATVTTAPPVASSTATPSVDVYAELQSIEDLLTGNDVEKREGLDKLHQLLRRIRPH